MSGPNGLSLSSDQRGFYAAAHRGELGQPRDSFMACREATVDEPAASVPRNSRRSAGNRLISMFPEFTASIPEPEISGHGHPPFHQNVGEIEYLPKDAAEAVPPEGTLKARVMQLHWDIGD